jgi:uncharacterized membrane protein YdbT with pleckstrin-like domain
MTPIRLLPNEKLIYKTNPHIFFLLGPLAGLFLLWLFLISLTCPLWRVIGPVSLCFLILTSAVVLSALVFYLDWRFNRLYLTNFRVIKERGIIGKKFTSIWLVKIQDMTAQFGFWGRIFGFGDLLIESAGELGQVRFKGLPRPLGIQVMIEGEIGKIPSSLV